MNAIKYLFEDINFPKSNLCPKYRFIDFIESKSKLTQSISFIFCSDNYLQKINAEFLNHKGLTDVITFNYTKKNNLVGDVFISAERVRENAKIYNVKFKEELARVMIHGVLHLIGYNDKKEKEIMLMRRLENEFLKIVMI
tara:strand:- start:200 stop:619 length:420 start_codon:yes stop_codon:yes gene_type:complete